MKINGTEVHTSVTADRVVEVIQEARQTLANPGLCIGCGELHDGCEPDAREYRCDGCDTLTVYGAEELAMWMVC